MPAQAVAAPEVPAQEVPAQGMAAKEVAAQEVDATKVALGAVCAKDLKTGQNSTFGSPCKASCAGAFILYCGVCARDFDPSIAFRFLLYF